MRFGGNNNSNVTLLQLSKSIVIVKSIKKVKTRQKKRVRVLENEGRKHDIAK